MFEQAAYSELAEGRTGLHQSAEEEACKMVEDQRSDSVPISTTASRNYLQQEEEDLTDDYD